MTDDRPLRLASALFGLVLGPGCVGDTSPPARPDVLLVILDTVRADAVRPDTAPYFEALATRGVRFDDATAPASWTWPSHASLFTGEPPWVHGAHAVPLGVGVRTSEREVRVSPLRTDLPTLAERFADAGYRTTSLAANPFLAAVTGLPRGFEHVEHHDTDEAVVTAALHEIDRQEPRPTLLFVNLMAAHAPYGLSRATGHLAPTLEASATPDWATPFVTEAPAFDFHHGTSPGVPTGVQRYLAGELEVPEDGMSWLRELYEGEVTAADESLGRLLEAWSAAHPDGIVAVSSDHGEAFGEHHQIEHGGLPYPEQTHVPLLLAAPGLPAGTRVSTPVQLHDLHPTLLELADIDQPTWSLVDATSGVPRPGDIIAASWPMTHRSRPLGGRHAVGWHLLRRGETAALVSTKEAVQFEGSFASAEGPTVVIDEVPGWIELYDLSDDPGMTRDLSQERPDEPLLQRARAEHPVALGVGEATSLPDDLVQRLQALGYVEP